MILDERAESLGIYGHGASEARSYSGTRQSPI